MTEFAKGVSIGTIPMTPDLRPDLRVEYHATEFPAYGTLITAPEAPQCVVENVLRMAIDKSFGDRSMSIMEMDDTRALLKGGDVVYKMGLRRSLDTVLGLSAFRANVSLQTGLTRIEQPADDEVPEVGPHYYTAPTYHAAFIPKSFNSRSSQVWAMSYESGYHPTRSEVPPLEKRLAIYGRAVESCKLKRGDVAYDDEVLRNTLVRRDDENGRLRIVKLDVLAAVNYEEYRVF